MSVEALFSQLSASGGIAQEFENETLYRRTLTADALILPQKETFKTILAGFPSRDTLTLHLAAQDADPKTFNLPAEIDDLFANLSLSKVTIKLEIDKDIQNDTISLYSSANFCKYLEGKSLNDRLASFNSLLTNRKFLIFELDDTNDAEFNSQSFYFTHSAQLSPNPVTDEIRSSFINGSREISHYSESSKLELVPPDFFIQNGSATNCLEKQFRELCLLVVLTALFDYTDGTGNELQYRLTGYITLKGSLNDFTVTSASLDQYLKITEWVFNGGNLSDKIGLARNMISLNLKSLPDVNLSPNTYDSIRSAYELYLKQNIKQYIEIRNKISDQLIDFNKRATQIIDNFGAGFQKSALAVLTFFASILVTKILSGGKLEDTFTYDAYYLTLVFILISVGYLILSYLEVNAQIVRFNKNYDQVKERYKDLLSSSDINGILNNDAEHLTDVDYLKEKKRYYLWLWIIVLAIILIITSLLHWFYVRDTFYDVQFYWAKPMPDCN